MRLNNDSQNRELHYAALHAHLLLVGVGVRVHWAEQIGADHAARQGQLHHVHQVDGVACGRELCLCHTFMQLMMLGYRAVHQPPAGTRAAQRQKLF